MSSRVVPGLLLVSAMTVACQSALPESAMRPTSDSLVDRQLETRRFDDIDEQALLAACVGLLQDLGFTIDESESELGLIVASRERPAEVSPAVLIVRWLGLLFLDTDTPVDERQRIRASVVMTPVKSAARAHLVRVTFQRIIWDTDNEVSRRERLDDPEIYRYFFDRLSKSVFLQAEAI